MALVDAQHIHGRDGGGGSECQEEGVLLGGQVADDADVLGAGVAERLGQAPPHCRGLIRGRNGDSDRELDPVVAKGQDDDAAGVRLEAQQVGDRGHDVPRVSQPDQLDPGAIDGQSARLASPVVARDVVAGVSGRERLIHGGVSFLGYLGGWGAHTHAARRPGARARVTGCAGFLGKR